jgi:hypothetical protein
MTDTPTPTSALDVAEKALEPFDAAAKVADFYTDEVLPRMAFPVMGTRLDPDGPPEVELTYDDLRRAREALTALRAAKAALGEPGEVERGLRDGDLREACDLAEAAIAAAITEAEEEEREAHKRTRVALFMAAAHCQGGHSDAGAMAAGILGVPFPIRMDDLAKRARAEGYDPDAMWPWWARMRAERSHAPRSRSKGGEGG